MARPTKLTDETHSAIVNAIKIGAPYKDAAGAAGVEYNTFNEWMKAGEKANVGKFHEFYVAITAAKHTARLNYVRVIAKAANGGDWRAAMEYLKRTDRETWGDSVDVTSGGEKIEIVFRETKLDDITNG